MSQLEEKLFLARLEDLERGAERGAKPCFSRFLDPGEVALFQRAVRPRMPYMLWGGYEDCERHMLGFFPDFIEPAPEFFPVRALRLSAKEELSHRAVLGSLMGLGLERNLIGDIAAEAEGSVVFVCDSIADFLQMNLDKVGRTRVKVTEAAPESLSVLPREFQEISGTVASLRLDCVVGLLTNLSRASVDSLLKRELVSLNHVVCTRPATMVSEGDLLSVRKFGRARVAEILGETKKGRIRIILQKYI